MANYFDQFDGASAEPADNFFDQFDEPAPTTQSRVPSFATAAMASAEAAPQPPPSKGIGHELMQGHIDNRAAIEQSAANTTRYRKPDTLLGEIEEYDFGPMIRMGDGRAVAFNPKTDVMLRHHDTGRLTAYARDPEIDRGGLDSAARILLEGFATGPLTRVASSNQVPLATQRGVSLGFPAPSAQAARTNARMRDAASFGELDVEPFAPAFRSKGAARFARTIEEMPVIGGVVKSIKQRTQAKLADAQARIASDLGTPGTDEAAGRTLQGGLDRFRTAGVREIEPGILAERGIEARAPVQGETALSQGARQAAERAQPIREQLGGGAAETVRGVVVPSARPLNETIVARRGVEDMSDAEIATLLRRPAAETSFATRQEALYEQAHRQIPALFRADNSRNPNLIATPNAGQVARGLMAEEHSASIRGGVVEGRFGQLVQDLVNQRRNFTLDSLRAARTQIGRALASFGEYDSRLDRSQLKALYGAVTRDMEVGLQTLANRAYERTQLGNNRADAVRPEVARAADRALYEMRRADRYTRVAMERMDRFARVLGADSPEAAMRNLMTRVRESTIDRGMIRSVADALRPDERNQVLGYIVANLGKGRAGAQEAEAGWNLHSFATDWNRNKTGLQPLIAGAPAGVPQRLDALAHISERMKYYESTRNYSGTAYSGATLLAGMSWLGNPALVLPSAILQVGGFAALGRFLTSPKMLDWTIKAAREGFEQQMRGPQVGGIQWPARLAQLEAVAANDNELGPVIAQALGVINGRAVKGERDRSEDRDQRDGSPQPFGAEPDAGPQRNQEGESTPHQLAPNTETGRRPPGMMRLGGPTEAPDEAELPPELLKKVQKSSSAVADLTRRVQAERDTIAAIEQPLQEQMAQLGIVNMTWSPEAKAYVVARRGGGHLMADFTGQVHQGEASEQEAALLKQAAGWLGTQRRFKQGVSERQAELDRSSIEREMVRREVESFRAAAAPPPEQEDYVRSPAPPVLDEQGLPDLARAEQRLRDSQDRERRPEWVDRHDAAMRAYVREAAPVAVGGAIGPILSGVAKVLPAVGRGVSALAARFPKTTGAVEGAAIGGAVEASGRVMAPAEAQESPDEIMELQRKLQAEGYYDGKIDGVRGEGTKKAIQRYQADAPKREEREAREKADRDRQADRELEREKTQAARDAALAAKSKAEADEAETKRLKEKEEADSARRAEGNERLRKVEDEVSWPRKLFRDYAPIGGFIAGGALAGVIKRSVLGASNRASEAAATRANALVNGSPGDWPRRVSRVNQFWAEGQPATLRSSPAAPFVVRPGSQPPYQANPNAPPATELYLPNRAKNALADIGVTSGFGADAIFSHAAASQFKAELDEARREMQKDPSESNIGRYQAAIDKVAAAEFFARAGWGGAVTYPAASIKFGRSHSRPDVSRAEAERLRIEGALARNAPHLGNALAGNRTLPPRGPDGRFITRSED